MQIRRNSHYRNRIHFRKSEHLPCCMVNRVKPDRFWARKTQPFDFPGSGLLFAGELTVASLLSIDNKDFFYLRREDVKEA